MEAFRFLKLAINRRIVKKTECNNNSSWSHLLFKLEINSYDRVKNSYWTGTLVLVDLAGSEWLNYSKT